MAQAPPNKVQFLKRLSPLAKDLESRTGIPSTYSLALAAHQTNYDLGQLTPTPAGVPNTTNQQQDQVNSQLSPEQGFTRLGEDLTTRFKSAPKTPLEFSTGLRAGGFTQDPAFDQKFSTMHQEVQGLTSETQWTRGQKPDIKAIQALEQSQVVKVPGEHLSDSYIAQAQDSQRRSGLATRAMAESKAQLDHLRQPDAEDFLAHAAKLAQNPLAGGEPQPTPAKQALMAKAQQAYEVAATEKSRADFTQKFLEAAPYGYQTGDLAKDFPAALDQYITQVAANSGSPTEEKSKLQGMLTEQDRAALAASWGEMSQTISRHMSDQDFSSVAAILETKPTPRVIAASNLSIEEIKRSLGPAAPARLPDGLDKKALQDYLAHKGADPQFLADLASSKAQWRQMAQDYYLQNEALKARRAGDLVPGLAQISGWDWLKLGAEQPGYLLKETAESYRHNLSDPYFGLVSRAGLLPVVAAAGGAVLGGAIGGLFGAGVGAVPGAVLGASLGFGIAGMDMNLQSELTKQWDQIHRLDPEIGWREANARAWEQAELGEGSRFMYEVLGDPTNLIGSGLATKFIPAGTKVGKFLHAYDKGVAKFFDVSGVPLVFGVAGGSITSNPLGILGGVGLGILAKKAPQTFVQLARRSSAETSTLFKALATLEAKARPSAVGHADPQILTEDFKAAAAKAVQAITNDPVPAAWTKLHDLGLRIWQTGFKLPSFTSKFEHANLTQLYHDLGVEVPTVTKFTEHNLAEALHSNIGSGSFYKKPEMVTRLAAELELDPHMVVDGTRTVGDHLGTWLDNYQAATWDQGLAAFTRRPTDDVALHNANTTRALMKFADDHEANLLDIMRSPGYQLEHSQGISGHAQRFVDALGRNSQLQFVDRMVQGFARQNLLFIGYGPWNVVENGMRMMFGGVNPMPIAASASGHWIPTAMDTAHFAVQIAGDLSNLHPTTRALSEEFSAFSPVTARVSDSTGVALQGLQHSGREGWIPGITMSTPAALDKLGLALPAEWIRAHIPQQFWSLRNFNQKFDAISAYQSTMYRNNRYLQALGEVDPVSHALITTAIGDITQPLMQAGMKGDLARMIQYKLRGYATTGNPDMIRALRMSVADLASADLTSSLSRTLSRYPELGELHTRSVLAAIRNGDISLGANAQETASKADDFFQRLQVSWWDQSVVGRMEHQADAIPGIVDQLRAFRPQSPQEIVQLMSTVHNTINEAHATASGAMVALGERQRTLTGQYQSQRDYSIHAAEQLRKTVKGVEDLTGELRGQVENLIANPDNGLTPNQTTLLEQWYKLQEKSLAALKKATAAEQLLHDEVYVKPSLFSGQDLQDFNQSGKQGDLQEKAKDAWARYFDTHYELEEQVQVVQNQLAQGFGIQVRDGTLPQGRLRGIITAEDVAKMYNTLPESLLRGIIDPHNLQMMSREEWTSKHLARAESLAKASRLTAEDFGMTREALGEVYDGLLRSGSLEPAGANTGTARQAWFRSMRDDVIRELQVATPNPVAHRVLMDHLEQAALRTQKLVNGGNPGYTRYFHGTNTDFVQFDPNMMDPNALFQEGAYTSASPELASTPGYTQRGGNYPEIFHLRNEIADHKFLITDLERRIQEEVPRNAFPEELRADLNRQIQDHERLIQGKNAQLQDLEAQGAPAGGNVRAIDIPDSAKFLNADEFIPQELIDAFEARFNSTEMSAKVARDGGVTGEDFWGFLKHAANTTGESPVGPNARKAARAFLQEHDYVGITHMGGGIPGPDGTNVPHQVKIVWPENLDILKNSIGNPPKINKAEWNASRAKAMDQANQDYGRDFPDYDNGNLVDSVMKSIYPFWMYEKNRLPWALQTFVRRPNTMLTWSRYMEATDDGYIGIPGTNLQLSPLRGIGAFMGGFRGLMRAPTPEYQDQFPEAPTHIVQGLQRVGFYPGVYLGLPLAIFGGSTPQPMDVLPSWTNTFLGAIDNTPGIPEPVKNTIFEHLFPDRFRDFRTLMIAEENGSPGTTIYNKIQGGVPLTEEENAAWQKARRYVNGVSGTLDAQFGMFRLRGRAKREVYEAMQEAHAGMLGLPLQTVKDFQRTAPVTGKRLSDYFPMDPLQQWATAEYFSKYENYLRPQANMLLPSGLGEQQTRIMSYYDEVNKIWERARTQGFYEQDAQGKSQPVATSKQQLEQQFRSGAITPVEYTRGMAETQARAQSAASELAQNDYYRNVPKTRKEREDFYRQHQMPVPTFSSAQELQWEYYSLRPKLEPDENGVVQPNWDNYYATVDALLEAMNPEVRNRFLAKIQTEWTDTQRLHWEHSKQYLAPYRNAVNVTVGKLQPQEQDLYRQYQKADAAGKATLKNQYAEEGQPDFFAGVEAQATLFRQNLRVNDPELDASLLLWGKTTKVLTPEAMAIYNRWIDQYRPGGTKLTSVDQEKPNYGRIPQIIRK